MVCRKCGAGGLRRENRQGFLQSKIFPFFGLYPWECVFCRKTLLYRKHFEDKESGIHRRASDAAKLPAGRSPRPARP
jgi:hypothetical protein